MANKTPEKQLEANRRWHRENRERRRISHARWYRANAEKISAANALRQNERVMANREYYRKHPEKLLARRLKYGHGMTLDQYRELHARDEGRCAICKIEEEKCAQQKLHIDHDHQTGKRRGLLCGSCNRMLGLAKDSKDTLLAAIKYLEERGGCDS